MSDEENNTDMEALCTRVQELTTQINEFAAKRRRKQRITAIVGVLLAVTVSFSLGGLTNMTKRLDAEAIAQIGRQKIQDRLPGARVKVQNYLEAEAPRIVGNTLRSMMNSLPHVRGFIFKGLNTKLDELNFEFEKKTLTAMTTFVQESKIDIDNAFPDMTDREKLEKLVDHVSRRFADTIAESTRNLYPAYKEEMGRLIAHLDNLEHKDPATLTDKEKTHKEIIQTLLQMLERRQEQLALEELEK
jgi:hypothetical protein